jgi:Periplasmic component of the Tol biopolymer transport system
MNEHNFSAPVLVLIALALLIGAVSAEEFQVTNASVDQVYSTVLDDRILWSDNRTGDYDVYLYNLTEESECALSPPETDQFATALSAGMMMSGDKVVWEDNRTGNRDIYLYDLATGEETQITTGTGHEINPAIAGDWIVWQDARSGNWDIYLYDLATGEETRITTNESTQMTPAVTTSMVVWNDFRHGNWDIYAWIPDEAVPSVPGPALTPASPGAPGASHSAADRNADGNTHASRNAPDECNGNADAGGYADNPATENLATGDLPTVDLRNPGTNRDTDTVPPVTETGLNGETPVYLPAPRSMP